MFPSNPSSPSYKLRQSNNVKSSIVAESDGDDWCEKLAVCESATSEGKPKLSIRSYYRNERTGQRNWDEPPSGASKVTYATAEMRRTAQVEMDELQLTLEMIPSEHEEDVAKLNISNKITASKNENTTKKSIFSRFNRKKEKKTVEVAKDLNLQRAIARSMMESYPTQNVTTSPVSNDDEDPDVALAKALSISECDASRFWNEGNDSESSLNELTEEELFQRAVEASKRDISHSKGVAANQYS
jgi:hypothetical protein